MYDNNGIEEFAMLIDLPDAREREWDRAIRHAPIPHGITCAVRTPRLLILTVQSDTEFEAIEKAERWLRYVAQSALPPIPLNLNPQPCGSF